MIGAVLKFLGSMLTRAATFAAFFLWSRDREKRKEAEKDLRTHEKARDIDRVIEFDRDKRDRVRKKYDGS